VPLVNLCTLAHNNRRFTWHYHGTMSTRSCTTGMRVRAHANRIPIVLECITLVRKKFDLTPGPFLRQHAPRSRIPA